MPVASCLSPAGSGEGALGGCTERVMSSEGRFAESTPPFTVSLPFPPPSSRGHLRFIEHLLLEGSAKALHVDRLLPIPSGGGHSVPSPNGEALLVQVKDHEQ